MNASPERCESGDQDEQLLDLLQASVYPTCDRYMLVQIVRYCAALGLDPTLRPVHVLPLRDKQSQWAGEAIVPGIGAYRTIAARCGCAGIDEPQFGPEVTEQFGPHRVTYPSWCRVTVRRRLATGEVACFTAREFWSENAAFEPDGGSGAVVPNEMWRRRPFGQLGKCAEAQALRRGFPEVGAQPVLEELTAGVVEALGQGAVGLRSRSSARPPVAMPQPRAPHADDQESHKIGEQVPLVLDPAAGQASESQAPSSPRKRPVRSRAGEPGDAQGSRPGPTPAPASPNRPGSPAAIAPPAPLAPAALPEAPETVGPGAAAARRPPAAPARSTTTPAGRPGAGVAPDDLLEVGKPPGTQDSECLTRWAEVGAAHNWALFEIPNSAAPQLPAAGASCACTCGEVTASRSSRHKEDWVGAERSESPVGSDISAGWPAHSPASASAAARREPPAAMTVIRLQGLGPGEADDRAITAGERDCLMRRLRSKGWSIGAARQAAGLPPGDALDELTRRGVAALLAVTA